MPNNPDVQSSVRERFSNMKVKPYPSYYDGPSNKANLAKQKQRVSLTQRHHNWEMANNPQIVPVPGEFDIEDASQPSQPSSTVDNILNTDNSVFLSSQLLSGGHQDVDGGEVIVNETPEESNVDDNTQSDEFIAPTPPSIDIAPPPKRRRTISADEPIIVATDNDSYVPVTPVTPTNDTASNQQNAIVATASTSAEHAFGSIFKIPTTPLNVTYLQSINIENVSYRFHVNQRPRDIHHNICHQQEELCTVLGFKCDGIHNVQLNGENTRKILKFKSTEWRSVQAILDAVKEFTYNAYTRLPPKATLFERSLHCLFASTSKFSNVHIQRVQYNEANNTDECSVLDTVYSLKWAPLCLQWTVDPYILKEAQFKTRQLEPSPSSEAEWNYRCQAKRFSLYSFIVVLHIIPYWVKTLPFMWKTELKSFPKSSLSKLNWIIRFFCINWSLFIIVIIYYKFRNCHSQTGRVASMLKVQISPQTNFPTIVTHGSRCKPASTKSVCHNCRTRIRRPSIYWSHYRANQPWQWMKINRLWRAKWYPFRFRVLYCTSSRSISILSGGSAIQNRSTEFIAITWSQMKLLMPSQEIFFVIIYHFCYSSYYSLYSWDIVIYVEYSIKIIPKTFAIETELLNHRINH